MKTRIVILFCILGASILISIWGNISYDKLFFEYDGSPPIDEFNLYGGIKVLAMFASATIIPVIVYSLFSNRKRALIFAISTLFVTFFVLLFVVGLRIGYA